MPTRQAAGAIEVQLGSVHAPAATVTGKSEPILRRVTGRIAFSIAEAAGVRWEGPRELLRGVLPCRSRDSSAPRPVTSL
jgi:hypothetical protein